MHIIASLNLLATDSFTLCFDSSLFKVRNQKIEQRAFIIYPSSTLDDTDNAKQVDKQKNTLVDSFSIAWRSNTDYVVDFQVGKIILFV